MLAEPIVVNLFGGPGAGKSTASAGLFYELKRRGHEAELIQEFAKDMTYAESWRGLSNQIYIFGEQHHRLFRLVGKVDVVVSDASFIHGLVYNARDRHHLSQLILEEFHRFRNLNFLIERDPELPYSEVGRYQNAQQARGLDGDIRSMLAQHQIPYTTIHKIDHDIETIIRQVEQALARARAEEAQ